MLSQRRFAELYKTARRETGVKAKELKARTGLSANTFSRYGDPGYPSGPPDPGKRRALESAMALPMGYLDGAVTEVDWNDVRRRLASAGAMTVVVPAGTGKAAAFLTTEVTQLVREQIAGYERLQQLIPPSQVLFWLSMLEGAMAQSGAGEGTSGPAAADRLPQGAARSSRGRRHSGGAR